MSRDAIVELVHKYADGVVYRDPEQWSSTWAPDAVWVLGPGREVVGRDAILALWTQAIGTFDAVVQNVVNQSVVLDEDAGTGSGRCYIMEHFLRADGNPGILLAHYDDTYVRINGEWLFSSRRLHSKYQGPPDLSAPFLNSVKQPAR